MEDIKVLMSTLAVTVLTGVIGILGAYARLTLKKIELRVDAETAKIEDEKTRNMVELAFNSVKDVVTNAVITAETTTVAQIKQANEDGKLTKEDGERVLNQVKETVSAQVSTDTKNALTTVIGSFDDYVEQLIHAQLAQITGKLA